MVTKQEGAIVWETANSIGYGWMHVVSALNYGFVCGAREAPIQFTPAPKRNPRPPAPPSRPRPHSFNINIKPETHNPKTCRSESPNPAGVKGVSVDFGYLGVDASGTSSMGTRFQPLVPVGV